MRKASLRHLPHPDVPLRLLPRPPVLPEHRGAGLDLERHADPVYIEDIGVLGQHAVHIVERIAVLDFVIHMEDPNQAL